MYDLDRSNGLVRIMKSAFERVCVFDFKQALVTM